MMTLVPFFAYVVVFASLPLVYATLKTATPEKLRDRVFLKSVFKDYLRTVPICALICLPVLVFPRIVCAYAICLHLVFALPLALELGHVHLFGTRVGINTFYSLFVTNVRETREFFRQSVSVAQRLLILATWFLPVFFLWRLDAGRAAEDPLRMMWIVGFAAAAVPFFVNLLKGAERRKDGYILNPYSNLICNYVRFRVQYRELKDMIARHSAEPFSGIVSSLPADEPQTYVVVIGESSSALHHHYCGYARETNEFTDAIGDGMLRFHNVKSPFAQTLPVLELVLTFADKDHRNLIWEKGSVVDYFHDTGFEVFWMSNQYALDDTAITAITAGADKSKCYNFGDMKRFEKAGLDGAMLPDFEKTVLSQDTKKKIVFMHLIGSHSAYVNRYPSEFKHFTGQAPGKSLSAAKAQMLNAYDDSVRYTDWFIAKCVEILRKSTAASYLLYFSDHGEDVFDSCPDKILGHSQLANGPMTKIPMMLWVSDRLDKLRPDIRRRADAANDGYDLSDVIHTIIDVSSLSNKDFEPFKSILNKRRRVDDGKTDS